MNIDYAKRWCDALSTDTSAFADLYAADGDFCIERHMMDDHMNDTISDRAMLHERLGGLANDDASNGIGNHTFTATEYIGDERFGMIHWDYSCEGANTYRGLPSAGKSLKTVGSTFLKFNGDGKIILESTCTNDNPIFQELGIPVMTPHYWDADFDPASLLG
jgi:steroid delta-isomerase-like uncharacterized protein